jgi:hypothetical protein
MARRVRQAFVAGEGREFLREEFAQRCAVPAMPNQKIVCLGERHQPAFEAP